MEEELLNNWKRNNLIDANLPCLVLGSAPDPRLPKKLGNKYTLICINCSGWSAKKLALAIPKLTVLFGGLLTKPSNFKRDRETLKGLRTDKLLYIRRSNILPAEVKNNLAQLGYQCGEIEIINRKKKVQIFNAIVKCDWFKISNGIFSNGILAVCLALYLGAPEVVLSGISLTKYSHAYDRWAYIACHKAFDAQALMLMYNSRLPIKTSEPELSRTTGIELIK